MGSNTDQKSSHEPIYKTYTKIEAKSLRATTFAIAKMGSNREKSNIAIALLDKRPFFKDDWKNLPGKFGINTGVEAKCTKGSPPINNSTF